jgi:hypothetical protein
VHRGELWAVQPRSAHQPRRAERDFGAVVLRFALPPPRRLWTGRTLRSCLHHGTIRPGGGREPTLVDAVSSGKRAMPVSVWNRCGVASRRSERSGSPRAAASPPPGGWAQVGRPASENHAMRRRHKCTGVKVRSVRGGAVLPGVLPDLLPECRYTVEQGRTPLNTNLPLKGRLQAFEAAARQRRTPSNSRALARHARGQRFESSTPHPSRTPNSFGVLDVGRRFDRKASVNRVGRVLSERVGHVLVAPQHAHILVPDSDL